ncbi:MAG: DUF502 domain-containing protein, partial [candidate division Zixibacteria bacterium]|nr:DUF502 domain-containing protein [candidate division Zixibacteria bacterium]
MIVLRRLVELEGFNMANSALEILRKRFVGGVLVVIPLIVTYVALKFLFESIDGILSPVIYDIFGYSIFGQGALITIVLILLVGFFSHSLFGATIIRAGEKVLNRAPGVRTIYIAAKQLLEAVTLPQGKAFKQVALIEFPRKGVYSLCFVVGNPKLKIDIEQSEMITLFIPSTPTPVSGAVIMTKPEEVTLLDMT